MDKMKRLGILHISDLHFGYAPELRATKKAAKKIPISQRLMNELIKDDPREIFLNSVSILLQKREVDIIAFTGDAGWTNNQSGLELGILYLSKLRKRLNVLPENVIISPGNHDLDRSAQEEDELNQLNHRCKAEQFTFAGREEPACVRQKGIPVIAINTCLGGAEQAFYGLPKELIKFITKSVKTLDKLTGKLYSKLPEEMKSHLKSMDIPAVGQKQLNSIDVCLGNSAGNCAIVLGHHNLLPTHRLIIRPFADIVDSGRLFFNLLGGGRRILFLHGHTHCDTAVIARAPDDLHSGFIACLGGNGLHSISHNAVASASYIEVLTDDNSNFLTANVQRFQQNGVDFLRGHSFAIWDEGQDVPRSNIEIDKLPPRISYYLTEVAQQLGISDYSFLAVELLRRRNFRQIEILDLHKPMEDWRITKNP
jgi:hypothetical protein